MKLAQPLVIAGLLAAATVAHAQRPSSGALARAEALFEQGRSLLEQKRFDEACPLLEESMKLDEAGGTLAALALCHQGQGKAASAWAEFKALLAVASRSGHIDRRKLAESALSELEPRLSWLTIEVPVQQASLVGLEITVDGSTLGRASWGVPLPLDPGRHLVVARAPGFAPWQAEHRVEGQGQRSSLHVGPLQPVAPPTPSPSASASSAQATLPSAVASSIALEPPSAKAAPVPARRPTASLVLAGGGLVLLSAGAYFGLRAISDQNRADRACPQRTCNDDEAISASHDASRLAWFADAGAVLGASAMVAAYLLLPSSSAGGTRQGAWQVAPTISPTVQGIRLNKSF